jgi:hypothetical protein
MTATLNENSEEKLIIERLRQYYAPFSEEEARKELQERYGNVWNDAELMEEFAVQFFSPTTVHVIRKDSGAHGTVAYLTRPRLYFSFVPTTNRKHAGKKE